MTLAILCSGQGGQHREMFALTGDAPVGMVADLYGIEVHADDRNIPLGTFLAQRLPAHPVVGDWVGVGEVELVVVELDDGKVIKVAVAIDPEPRRFSLKRGWTRLGEEVVAALRRLPIGKFRRRT